MNKCKRFGIAILVIIVMVDMMGYTIAVLRGLK